MSMINYLPTCSTNVWQMIFSCSDEGTPVCRAAEALDITAVIAYMSIAASATRHNKNCSSITTK